MTQDYNKLSIEKGLIISTKRLALVRIDDIGYFDEQDRIIYLLCNAGIKVSCSVVPTWLTFACVDFLQKTAQLFPNQLEVHQHGYSHINYDSAGLGQKFEFGPLRSLEAQREDIAVGKVILKSQLGNLFFPVFTPPYGEYNNDTLVCLQQLGFQAISSISYNESNNIIPDYPTEIDCFTWNPVKQKSLASITEEWKNKEEEHFRGLVLHPRLMELDSLDIFTANLCILFEDYQTVNFADLLFETNNGKYLP